MPLHEIFVGLGVAVASVVFFYEARSRGALNEQSLVAVTGALVGGAIGMRLARLAGDAGPAAAVAVRLTQRPRRAGGRVRRGPGRQADHRLQGAHR
ncbi:hypothetical protein ACFSTC_56710 [Nonomuraea ferruginea]